MRILIFSLGPIFPRHVHGGSQKILREVASYLGAVGHEVRILCIQRPDNHQPFELAPAVQVIPTFRLKPIYPEPYHTAPAEIASMIIAIRRNLDWCDRFYIHDGELPFHDVYSNVPTVVSFRDFVYPDTLVGGFGFRRDRLLLNSDYVARCVVDAFTAFLPNIVERIHVVPNGIDLSHFAPNGTGPSRHLRDLLGNAPPATFTVLYPHRPDKRKGIFEAVQITARLYERLAPHNKTVRLLIPRWIDSKILPDSEHEYQSIYAKIIEFSERLGIRHVIHIHDWIPYDLMPQYLSSGSVTLSVGCFVEAFGNVHLESIACGTPSVVSCVAAHAQSVPFPHTHRVPYGDISAAVEAVEELLHKPYDICAAREILQNQFPFDVMLQRYEEIITSTKIEPPLTIDIRTELVSNTQIRLAAWCRYDGKGIYHDYNYGRIDEPDRVRLARLAQEGIRLADLEKEGFTLGQIKREIESGVLILGLGGR
jgi:glycosyltransferase involved in cell wall biosynthesis